jgi:hypothetical protein
MFEATLWVSVSAAQVRRFLQIVWLTLLLLAR